jgi:hypothetical protein
MIDRPQFSPGRTSRGAIQHSTPAFSNAAHTVSATEVSSVQ